MKLAQWVFALAFDQAVPGSSSTCGGDLFNRKRSTITQSLSLSFAHRPDMTEKLLKRT